MFPIKCLTKKVVFIVSNGWNQISLLRSPLEKFPFPHWKKIIPTLMPVTRSLLTNTLTRVCVLFETGKVCDVMFIGCVTARKSVVKSVTACWKWCLSVCGVEIGLVDLVRVAIWKVDLSRKRLGLGNTTGLKKLFLLQLLVEPDRSNTIYHLSMINQNVVHRCKREKIHVMVDLYLRLNLCVEVVGNEIQTCI